MHSKTFWILIVLGFFQKSSAAICIDLPPTRGETIDCEKTDYNPFGSTVGERIADFFQGEGIDFQSLDDDYNFVNFRELNVRKLGKKFASALIDFLDGLFKDGYGTTTLDKFSPTIISQKNSAFCKGLDDSVDFTNKQFHSNGRVDLLELEAPPNDESLKTSKLTVGKKISELLWGISYHMVEYYKFCDFKDLNLRDFGTKVGKGLISSIIHKHDSNYGDLRRQLNGLYEKRIEFCLGIDDAISGAKHHVWGESGFIGRQKYSFE